MGDAAPRPSLDRPALAELLAGAAGSRVCTVIAAAGWGKTTAVRSWPLPSAWVPPAGARPDAPGFARCLLDCVLDALRPHGAGPPPALPDPARATGRGSSSYAAVLCEWLRASLRDDLAVVVDDLHELVHDASDGDARDADPGAAGAGVARLLDGLCRHAPPRLHLVLVSRRELPFSVTRLRGRGLVAELGAAELAFGLGEVDALLREAAGKCSPELTRQVWERTAGWPAAVHAAAEALRGVPEDERPGVLGRLAGPGENLHGYLAEEVVGAEPLQARRLLRWLAVFGGDRPGTAAATGVPDAPALLAGLARRGLVSRVAGAADRWVLARPLLDYFGQEPVLPGAERAALHRTAAAEYARRGAFETALRHAAAAGDHGACTALLAEHGAGLVNGGRADAVLAAAAGLPPGHPQDPAALLVVGHAHQVRGQWAGARDCLRRAGSDRPVLAAALAWRLAAAAYDQAEYAAVLRLPARVRPPSAASPGGTTDTRDTSNTSDTTDTDGVGGTGGTGAGADPEVAADEARLLAIAASARRMTGDYAGGRADADRAVRLATAGADPAALSAAHTALAILAAADGDRRRADAHSMIALEAAQAAGDLLQELRVRVEHAAALCELGLARTALDWAGAAVDLGQRCGDVLQVARAQAARGAALVRLGDLDRAMPDLGAARDTFQRYGSRMLATPLCGLGDVHRVRGQLARARAAYEQALATAEPGHDVLAAGSALAGLAMVRAADDHAVALALAERAIALGDGMRRVPALLARGWVALAAGDRALSAADAALAAAAARKRRDDPGLAEALMLGAVCAQDPACRDRALAEAVTIWQEAGCRLAEATALLVSGRLGARPAGSDAGAAEEALRSRGVLLRPPQPAGPLAVLAGSAPALSIRALGVFQVARDGVPISRTGWQSRKARQLLKIIVARRLRPVPREQLMELLWPDADPVKAGNRLSVLLSTLRTVLQPAGNGGGGAGGGNGGNGVAEHGPLVTDGSSVWLDRALVDVDVERFLEHAGAALDTHRRDGADAVPRLVAAEAAHAGGFLEDAPYEEWAAPLAEEVRATHVALLRALVLRLRGAGEVDEVVRYSLRLLDKDRYDERAHLDLADVLLAAGRHGEARRRYRIYRQAMAELGITPQPLYDPQRAGPSGAATGGLVIS